MYFVYLLRDSLDKIYIGQTEDVLKRLEEHRQGRSYWTRRMTDIRLIYYEAYSEKEFALDREKKLKKRASAYQGLIKRLGLK